MDNFDSTYSILNDINESTGLTYDSAYSICLAIYKKLGGTKTNFDSVYSLTLEIKEILPTGGGTGETEELEYIYTYITGEEPPAGATAEQLRSYICQAIDELNATITSQAATITSQSAQIETKDATIATQAATITSQTAEIQEQEATIDSQAATITAQTEEIATKQATITAQTAEIASQAATISQQAETITAQTAEIATKDATITSQTAEINTQAATITAQTAQINQQSATISQQEATITAQTAEIETKTATITAQTEEINNYSSGTANSYTAAANKGATIPQQQTIDNLPSTISSIPQAKPEEQLTETISSNGTTSYSPTAGSVFSGATITVDVPLAEKSISTNGTYYATGDSASGYSKVVVSCPEPKTEEHGSHTFQSNTVTPYRIEPTSGNVFDYVDVTVNVPSSGGFDTSQLKGFQLDYSLSTIDYGGFVAGDNFLLRDAYAGGAYSYVPIDVNISSYINLDRADFSKVTGVARGAFPTIGDSINLSNLRFTSCVNFGYYSGDEGPFSYYIRPSSGSVTEYLSTTVKYIYMDNMVFRDLASGGTSLSYLTFRGSNGSVQTRVISLTGTTLENVTSLNHTFSSFNPNFSETNIILGSTRNVKYFTYTFEKVILANRVGAATIRSVIENLDTSSAVSFSGMISIDKYSESGSYRYSLDLTGWNTSNVSDFSYLFNYRKSLETLDLTGWSATSVVDAYKISSIFNGMSTGVSYNRTIVGSHTEAEAEAGTIKVFDDLHVAASFDTTFMGYLNRASLLAIINGLRDMTGETGLTLTIGATALAKLTSDDIAKATAKNWTIA